MQKEIESLERTEEEARFEREPDDVGRFLLVPAFLLLVLGAIIRERKRVEAQSAAIAEAQPPMRRAA